MYSIFIAILITSRVHIGEISRCKNALHLYVCVAFDAILVTQLYPTTNVTHGTVVFTFFIYFHIDPSSNTRPGKNQVFHTYFFKGIRLNFVLLYPAIRG